MPSAVLTDAGLLASLTDRLLARLFIRLFRNNVPVLPGSAFADFSPAVFPGYADQELTGLWPAVDFDLAGRAFSRLDVVFTRGIGGVPETIYGWILYELPAPDSFLVAGRNLSPPQIAVGPGSVIRVQVTMYALRG